MLSCIAEADGTLKPAVRAWLADTANFKLLDLMRRSYVASMGPRWPLALRTFLDLVRKTLLGLQSKSPRRETWRYSISRTLERLHAVRSADGFEGLCAADHCVERQPGPWFQLDLLRRLIGKLEHDRVLEPTPCAQADCTICLERVVAGQRWQQLEPCRHWLCSACSTEYMMERGGHTCPECRAEVAQFVAAKGV